MKTKSYTTSEQKEHLASMFFKRYTGILLRPAFFSSFAPNRLLGTFELVNMCPSCKNGDAERHRKDLQLVDRIAMPWRHILGAGDCRSSSSHKEQLYSKLIQVVCVDVGLFRPGFRVSLMFFLNTSNIWFDLTEVCEYSTPTEPPWATAQTSG